MSAWTRRSLGSGVAAVVLASAWMWAAPAAAASQAAVRTVRGEVVAVNLQASPQVIVIRAAPSGKDALVVGATIMAETKVMRGSQAIGLDALKPGEIVSLTYSKQADGLVARSIQAP